MNREARIAIRGRSGFRFALLYLLAGSFAVPMRARAQGGTAPIVRLTVDNDLFALRGGGAPPDYDYTHGTRVELIWPGAPGIGSRGAALTRDCRLASAHDAGCAATTLLLGQEIYTPRHDSVAHVTGDRPHAALLSAGASIARLHGPTLSRVTFTIGVTGRPALGESVQNGVHRLLHNHLEQGWGAQLPSRLAASLDYGGAVTARQERASGASALATASWGAALGTLRRALRTGASARYSFGGASDLRAATPLGEQPRRLYVGAGYEESLVLHDALIEGDRGVPGAVRRPWIGEAFGAVGLRGGRIGVEYRYVSRGREYRAEPGRHAYGSIALELRP